MLDLCAEDRLNFGPATTPLIGANGKMSRKPVDPPRPQVSEDASEDELKRLDYVTETAERYFNFYNGQVRIFAWCHGVLTLITLLGTAVTPLLALLLDMSRPSNRLWIALPSAIAGLAAAATLHFA